MLSLIYICAITGEVQSQWRNRVTLMTQGYNGKPHLIEDTY
jgi:hypothetical protein